MRWRVVALEGALERATATLATGRLSLLRTSGSSKAITVADQLLVLVRVASLVAKSPEQHTTSSKDNGAANTDTDADDCVDS